MTSTPDLLSFRHAISIGGADGVAPRTVGRLTAPRLADRGFCQRENLTGGTQVYRIDDSGAQRVTLRDFRAHVVSEILDLLDETLAQHSTSLGIRRVRATRAALVRGDRGAPSWERLAVEHTRDALPDLSDDDAEAADEAARARRAAQAAARAAERVPLVGTYRERERVARAAARAAERERDDEELRLTLSTWLPATLDGPIEIGEIHDAWKRSVANAPRYADEHPGAASIGRTTFYRVALDLLDWRPASGRRRIAWAPYHLRTRHLMGRRDLVAALRLHAEHHGPTGDSE